MVNVINVRVCATACVYITYHTYLLHPYLYLNDRIRVNFVVGVESSTCLHRSYSAHLRMRNDKRLYHFVNILHTYVCRVFFFSTGLMAIDRIVVDHLRYVI